MNKRLIANLVASAALVMGVAASSQAATYSLTYQDVTFDITDVDSNTLTLTITNATNASGDWDGVGYFRAFEIGDIGVNGAGSTVTGPGSFVYDPGELNADGCTGGTKDHGCFFSSPAVALTDSMSWTIDYVGTLDISEDGPHLKVNFLTNADDDNKTGSNLSLNIPGQEVPVPGTLGLLGLGLAGLGLVRRRA